MLLSITRKTIMSLYQSGDTGKMLQIKLFERMKEMQQNHESSSHTKTIEDGTEHLKIIETEQLWLCKR